MKSVNVPRKSSNLLKRRLKIAEIVATQGEIKVDDLSAQLGVSGVTIRGDLSYLEQQGYLKRSFGGAIATPSPLNQKRYNRLRRCLWHNKWK